MTDLSWCVCITCVLSLPRTKCLPPSSYQPTDKNSKVWPLSACMQSCICHDREDPSTCERATKNWQYWPCWATHVLFPGITAGLASSPCVLLSSWWINTYTSVFHCTIPAPNPTPPPHNWTVSESSQKGNDSELSDKTVGWKNGVSCLCVLMGYQLCCSNLSHTLIV